MKGYKDRTVKAAAASEVYYNLHKHTFSMKQKGLVVLHADTIVLGDATFHVSEAGRQRVLEEQRKNVHATVRGTYRGIDRGIDIDALKEIGYREAYYNPYTVSTFVDIQTGRELHKANRVILTNKKVFYK